MIAFGCLILSIYFFCISIPVLANSVSDQTDINRFSKTEIIGGYDFDNGLLGHTAAWTDYNGDGWLDILISKRQIGFSASRLIKRKSADNGVARPKNRTIQKLFLFEGQDGNIFTDVSSTSGLPNLDVRAVSWADYDNDGFSDLLIATSESGKPPLLFRNINGSYFINVVETSRISGERSYPGHIIWADYDRDGLVDFFQANEGGYSILYKNLGDGSFMNVSKATGLNEPAVTKGAVWFDANNDGYADLFLANYGSNFFYINNGDGTFTDASQSSGLAGSSNWRSTSACSGDYNGDGFFDLYVTNIANARRNVLYLNNKDGTFKDVTWLTGTGDVGDGRTCSWIDFDSDGMIDLFTTNHVSANRLYKNFGNGFFKDVAKEAGIRIPSDVFAATWGDYDRDGDLDVFLNGHMDSVLMKNNGNSNNSITLSLSGDGIKSNSDAIGALVEIITEDGIQIREISGGRGCCEQDMLPVFFGLGMHKDLDIRITWPSGNMCSFENVSIENNRSYKVYENGCEMDPN